MSQPIAIQTSPTPPVRKGALLVSMEDPPVSWAERWVVLRDGRLTVYASSDPTAAALIQGPIRSAKKYDPLSSSSSAASKETIRVEVVSRDSPFYISSAASDSETVQWLGALSPESQPQPQPQSQSHPPADGDEVPRSERRRSKSYLTAPVVGSSTATASPPGSPGLPPSSAASASSKRHAKSEWEKVKRGSASWAPAAKSGWMKHRSVMKQWGLRYFVLRAPVLIYYKDEEDEAKEVALGIVNLRGCAVKVRTSKKDGFCFKIENVQKHAIYMTRGLKGEILPSGHVPVGSDEVILRVPSADEGKEWMKLIESAIEFANSKSGAVFLAGEETNSGGIGGPQTELATPTHGPAAASAQLSPQRRGSTGAISMPSLPPAATAALSDTPSSGSPERDSKEAVLPPAPAVPAPMPPSLVPAQTSMSLSTPQLPQVTITPAPKQVPASPVASTSSASAPVAAASPAITDSVPLDPPPSRYVVEIPRPEMKVDAFEQGKSMLLQIAKQLRPGMDLTKVVLPTHILEPRSFLEKTTDYFAHIELIREAIREPDPVQRMLKLTKWYMSGFYIMPKTPKKPYNPILGETYRCMWEHGETSLYPMPSKSFLVCEQVSHHPPISAFFACNRADGWVVNGSILFKSKFWGMSAGSLLEGFATLTLPMLGEEYTITFPSAVAKGFIIGPLTMELFGEVVIDCKKTGLTSRVEFKTKPAFRGDFNCVGGQIETSTGDALYQFSGRYDREILVTDMRTKETTPLWTVTPDLPSRRLPRYVIPLEEQDRFESEKLWLRVTKALIEGDQGTATEAKSILEEEQRAGCKQREESGTRWVTKYFDFDQSASQWVYRWINKTKFDPFVEAGEYESSGRIRSIYKQSRRLLEDFPQAAACSSAATVAALGPDVLLVPGTGGVAPPVSESVMERGPHAHGDSDTESVPNGTLSKLKEELEQQKERCLALERRCASLEAGLDHANGALRSLSSLTFAPPMQPQGGNRRGAAMQLPATVILAVLGLLFVVVLLMFRKVSMIRVRPY